MCVYFVEPSFNDHAGMLKGLCGFLGLSFNSSFLHSALVKNLNEISHFQIKFTSSLRNDG